MEYFEDHALLRPDRISSVVTIGSFDGLHLGHQLLIQKVKEQAASDGFGSALITFEPHPAKVLAPSLSPPLIMPFERKKRALAALGLDLVLNQRFDASFAELTAEQFVNAVLVEGIRAKHVIVGDDFTFGKNREGGVRRLAELGKESGLRVQVLNRLEVQGITISSTRIRSFVLQGKVRGAALLLGRPYLVEGSVGTGCGRGRGLGFPTANLETNAELLPPSGVYICHAWLRGEPKAYPALTNIGFGPTFGGKTLRFEVHLLAEIGDLVGERVAVAFLERVRPEQRFSSADLLVEQITRDKAEALAYFASCRYSKDRNPLDGIEP
jgi:riboflavin kinase / FMN adenylyltransferase